MRSRKSFWILSGLLLLAAGAWFFWPAGSRPAKNSVAAPAAAARAKSALAPGYAAARSASTAPLIFPAGHNVTNTLAAAPKTNPFPYRLTNTKKSLGELTGDRRAILLENALIDTGAKLDLALPKKLSSAGDPGAYIVQARGPVDAAFRAALAAAGAEIVSYIPNNAYLVRVGAAGAQQLAALTQAVIPYEPYYKVQSPLLAYAEKTLPPGATLNVGLFPNTAADTIRQMEKLGATVQARDNSPFGPVVRVSPPENWTALARLPGVQIVEGYHPRLHANDLSRQTTGVAADSVTTTNYLGLDGHNVLVQVNDSGIDATHPDLVGRVFGPLPVNLVDTNGHGTHVAGIIAGDGTEWRTVTNAQGSIMPATNFQFRGMAPKAQLFSMDAGDADQTLQQRAALTNALISNNSWNYDGDNTYNLAAASYDAAVRDALTQVTGSQPVLFVFSSGNAGRGNSDGGGGDPDTILSPATAKNVITVGALEELRNITNIVTDINSNSAPVWQPETDSSIDVAKFSSRGNVGVGTEGPNGRYKPDVVAPGTFVVSTRSQQWDEGAYYNPSNSTFNTYVNQVVGTNGVLNPYSISVPANAVAVIITLVSNNNSATLFPTNLPVYVQHAAPPTVTTYDFLTWNNGVSIPPDGGSGYLASVQNDAFNFAVGNTNNFPVSYDLVTEIITTNDLGDYFLVLSNLNVSLSGPPPPYYYRYESGTSMAAADVSGVLALMADFFTNTLHQTASPGLLKAMLVNGARATANYNFNPANSVNPEGWGQVSLPNSLPLSITNLVNGPAGSNNTSIFFLDQSPTNALATGDSQTFLVTVNTNSSAALPLRVTLAWTDPPGNPAAAIKLVNNLDLVVTNLATGEVFFGNDIPASSVFNQPWATNSPPNLDYINNIENVFLSPPLGGIYSVTVVGRQVNVNAVTAQTNDAAGVYAPNVVQDFSLVISCGDSADGGGITVAPASVVSRLTAAQIVTFITVTNTPLLNQLVGANTPLMGTNSIVMGTNTTWGTNGAITLGMTNQWHFFVVTNVLAYQYAAFITFLPDTLALPRTGVYADSTENSTQPEADIDLYVADPHQVPNSYNLTNLDPIVISATDKSLTRGGVEFVTYSNSAGGDVYYIGVKSEAQEGSQFGFMAVFSQTPFSQTDVNGNEYVQGVPLPVTIPDGSTARPGKAYVFGIATTPIEVERVVVTNTIVHDNFADLIGVLDHNGTSVVLNNHASPPIPLPPGPYTKIYDDSGRGDHPGSQMSDGPGTLQSFQGQEGVGPWILMEVDDSQTHTGAVTGLTIFIEKHRKLTEGIQVAIPPGTWFYTFLDVPPGYTNLSVSATNLDNPLIVPPLELYLDYNVQPDFSNYLDMAFLTNCATGTYPGGTLAGNTISYGPPLRPGTYYVGLFNRNLTQTANAWLIARLSGLASAIVPTPNTTNGLALLDDAVGTTTLFIGATQQIASINVGLVVNHPRISDLTFTLLSPSGQRVLLMENRGGSTTNGAGDLFITTNNFAPVTANGGGLPQTNYLNVGQTAGSITISWDMFTVPDEMTVYYGNDPTTFGTNNPNSTMLLDTGNVPGAGSTNLVYGPGTSTYLTVIMNEFGNPAGANGTRWTYTAGGIQTNYNYLMFTENTNLTTVPIKFAIPPFTYTASGTNYALSDFELATNVNYVAPTNIFDAFGGWNLTNVTYVMVGTNLVALTNSANMVSVVTDPTIAAGGSNFLALASGTIYRQVPMTPGRSFSLSYSYRGPGISGWWRGEGNATDSANPENLGNNGWLIGRFNYPAGEVGQAFALEDAGNEFQFAGTNTYVQIHQVPFPISVVIGAESNGLTTVLSSQLDVGTGSGLTVEGWINPTNVSFQQPLVEWLARPSTNLMFTNVVIEAGPFLDRATSHYYYLLGTTNWTTSESWAQQLGGHLVTLDTANEQNWVYDTFASYGGTNRNLWIGLTNNPPGLTNFTWSSGLTNPTYFNWQTSQPTNCSGADYYTTMLGSTNGQPGLWILADNTGHACSLPLTNRNYGVVEVDQLQPNGVQFWISVTNVPGTTNFVTGTNGCLFANLVDTTNGSHIIYSAPGLVLTNVFQHVALTYNTNSGLATLYYNGTNVASTNLGYFLPNTTGDVLLGRDMSLATNNFFGGKLDELSIYGRSLSAAEILAIYNVSFLTTNRTIGKFDPSITPALSLAEARVSLGALTNLLLGNNTAWQSQSFSFTAVTNSLLLQVSGLEPGMLLDSFNVSEDPLGNLYYFPEQPLDSLNGQSAFGTWTLQILDNRTGAYITNGNQLVSWQLQFVLQTNTLPQVALDSESATTISVPPGETVVLTVAVPSWANAATNVLVSSTLPVDLLFNQTNPPTGSPLDYTLLTGSTAGIGSPVLTTTPPSIPPLLPGQTYYLGVRNPGTHSATAVVRVDYDIPSLTNGVPVTGVLTTNASDAEHYYVFNVSSTNAYAATFQLLNLNGNADLVVRKGAPLPTLTSSDYGSFNTTNADENIYVLTNSAPVPLSAGLWYLGVFKRDFGPVRYTVLAKELDTAPNIIELSNGVPFNFTAGPGAALTNFFHFGVAGNPGLTNAAGIHFELYNQSGNGDLTVQTNAVPLAPPFYQTSRQPGVLPEFISIRTNSAQTNLFTTALTNLNVDWYLGVPNNTAIDISYTILAVLDTNSVFPAFPGAEGAGAGALGGGGPATGSGHGTNGTVYHVVNLNDSGTGSLRDAVSSTNRTIVFDVSGTINLASRLVITNSYLTIAGQTAPGGGITVAGYETSVTNAHDVIIRYLRFRPDTNGFDALRFITVSNVIADHVSAEWSPLQNSAALDSANLTVQWSMISDSLFSTNTPNGGTLLRFGNGAVTLHHNLYANNFAGSPHLDDNLSLDFVNNVIYGWGTNAGFSFGTNNPAGFTNQLNYVCNYLIASTNSFAPAIAFWGGSTNTWIYQTNNFIDSDTNGILNGSDMGWAMFTNRFTQIGQPFPLPPVSTDEAFLAYEKVLDFAGAGLFLRDSVDADIVTGVRNQTGTIIAAPPLSGMVAWWPGDGNANDIVGTNNGTPLNVTYASGEVGQAFVFNGSNSRVKILASPSLNVGLGAGFTLETWVNPAVPGQGPLFDWNNAVGGYGVHLWLSVNSIGDLYANVQDITGTVHPFSSAPGIMNTNEFQHVALTYNKVTGVGVLYRNGVVVASQFLGIFTPETSRDLYLGNRPAVGVGDYFNGKMDEVTIYKRVLSASEIQSIYNAGSAGKFSAAAPVLPYLDTDRDGIPDFWETTFGQFPTNVSNFLPSSTAPGYTDLEEYLNWLGAPHALTITNTSVGVDLYQLCGNSGKLSFFLTNAVNGTVYLTNVLSYTNSLGIGINVTNTGPFSNRYAIFTPPTNSSGYASFGFYVTNNATVAYFGPVTVSVVVSSVPIVYAADNTNVPPVFVNGSLTNQTFNELTLLTVTNTATLVNTNLSLSYGVTLSIDTAAMLASNWPTTYVTTTPSPLIDANGVITWTPSEAQGPGVYLITTVATDNSFPPLTATNSFSVVVNEVNLAPFWPTNVPSQTNYTVSATTTLIVTNTASDLDIPPNSLTYQLFAPTNAVISTNGIITWTPTPAQVGLYTFTTIVTDTNPYALFNQSLSNTNVFTVLVTAVAAPFVFTEPAQAVTGTSAQLNGMVTPNGLPTTAWFEWGTNTTYGTPTPSVNVGNGYNVVYTTNKIGSLTLNVPYHFRLVAANAAGTNYGFDQILDEANVVAWGANYAQQAVVPAGLSNVTAIAGAYDHSLALRNNGTVVSWGNNTLGYLTVPSNLTNVLAVAGGEYYSMALKNNGTVTAWGANVFPGQTNVPAGLSNVVVIAGGTFSSIALKNNGSVVAWGANIFGVINVPASASNTVAVAGGFFHSLAIKNDGTVFGWGDNSAGQLTVPAGVTNAVAIAAGNAHSLALKYDGTVVAWGDNGDGQTDVPPGLTNVVAIAAGGFNSMALKNDGKIVTWGDNTTGQSSVPVGLTNAVAIAGGNLHSLALTPQSSASLTNPVVMPIVNGVPQTNNILPGSITYYQVDVPANATFATNSLLFASGTLNVWFTTNVPPTIAKTNDSLLLGALTNGVSVLSLTSAPTNIIPGRTYYLGVQNTNSVTVNYGIEVDFHLVPPVPPAISGIIFTNGGFLLTWFAPSNDLFQVQFTTNLAPANWTTFTNIISYNTNAPGIPPNAQFNFFDDGVLYPFGPTRFYRLILLAAPVVPTNSAPVFIGNPATQTINPLAALVVTNAATDADVPAQTLTYTLLNPPVGAVINPTNGLITWTPSLAQAGTSNSITTVVTDSGTPNLSATNSFAVLVNPIPVISSVTYISSGTTNGFLVKWYAPTNDQFKVQWTTNLSPVNWQTFSNLVTYTGPATPTNGLFTFFDDGSQTGGLGAMRFYRLLLLGGAASTNTPPTLPAQATRNVTPLAALTVTNTAADTDLPAQTLTYTLTNSLAGTNLPAISTNGVITWTPTLAQAGVSNTITTIVTDNGVPPLSATNQFSIVVNAIPSISSVTLVTNGLKLTWFAPTNEQFRVQSATNLLSPVVWVPFPGIITSTNGTFTFTDTNAPLFMKFYELLLLP